MTCNKSLGLYGICYEHLKYGGKLLQRHLCSLFNLVLETCYTLISWKDSCIIPLFKGGNKSKSDPNSYRGISLLCSISKLFEKALYTRRFVYHRFITTFHTNHKLPTRRHYLAHMQVLTCKKSYTIT